MNFDQEQTLLDAMDQSDEAVEDALSIAWGRINSLGGRHDGSSFEVGYAKALADVLGIIEDMGGRDPLVRKQENSQFGVGA